MKWRKHVVKGKLYENNTNKKRHQQRQKHVHTMFSDSCKLQTERSYGSLAHTMSLGLTIKYKVVHFRT